MEYGELVLRWNSKKESFEYTEYGSDGVDRVNPKKSGVPVVGAGSTMFVHYPVGQIAEYRKRLFDRMEESLLEEIDSAVRAFRAIRKLRRKKEAEWDTSTGK